MAALVAAAFVVNAYRRKYYGGLLVAPAIAVLFVMNIFPLLWSLGLSFFAYQSNQQSIRFVGLNNYIKALTNDLAAPANWAALVNTAMFVVFTVAAQMIVGFLLAMLFAKQFPLRKYLLILVLTPMMLSVVAVGVFFPYYYDPTFGLLSYVIGNITGEPVHPDGQQGGRHGRHRLRRCLDVVALRHAAGAGRPRLACRNISTRRPPSTACRSGGSSGPSPSPISAACCMLALLFRTIEAFKLSDLVILLTKGGNDTMTISYHLIRIANEQNKTSRGCRHLLPHAVHGDRADQSLSLSRQPPQPGGLSHGRTQLHLGSAGLPQGQRRRRGRLGPHARSSAIVAFIYFLPVLLIIFTAFKPQDLALSVPPTLSPTSLFGLIPDQYVFTPTLENFGSVFSALHDAGRRAGAHGLRPLLLQLDLHRRRLACCWRWSSARSPPSASRAIR